MKLNIRLGSKEALAAGALSALGQVIVSEVYRTYVDIDPFAGVRNRMKMKKREKLFNRMMPQIDLKKEQV